MITNHRCLDGVTGTSVVPWHNHYVITCRVVIVFRHGVFVSKMCHDSRSQIPPNDLWDVTSSCNRSLKTCHHNYMHHSQRCQRPAHQIKLHHGYHTILNHLHIFLGFSWLLNKNIYKDLNLAGQCKLMTKSLGIKWHFQNEIHWFRDELHPRQYWWYLLYIQVIKENVVLRCKCHGVSDSCEMKTCWKELSLFQDAGNDLLRKYDSAVKVKFDRKTRKIVKTTKITDDGYKRGGRRRSTSNRPSSDSLVYLNTSPDYCRRSNKHETLGTVGRECRGDTSGPGNCKELCCRRGFLSRTENTIERCECKFVWCCKVSCKQCMIARTKYNCL